MSHQLETIIGYKFKHPELLETRPEHINYDYDFSDWQKKQDAKAAKKAAKLAAKAKK